MTIVLADRSRLEQIGDRRVVARVRIRLVNADAWEAVAALDGLGGYERALLAELEREASG